jgi:hypothetical protein
VSQTDGAATAIDEFDEWDGESGFKDDYSGLIVDSFFTKDSNYNNGETLILKLKIIADDGEEVEQIYPCGADWDSYDNGETAEHPKDREGRPKAFNHNSAIYGLIRHAFEAGAEDTLKQRGRPRKASIWRGLKFHWKVDTQTFTIKDRKTGEDRTITTNRTYPEKFLGVFDVDSGTQEGAPANASTSTPAPQSGAATSTASSEGFDEPTPAPGSQGNNGASGAGATPFDLTGFDPSMIGKLKIHAKSKSYTDFLDAAMAVDGVTTNDQLLDLLGQEPFYAHLRG